MSLLIAHRLTSFMHVLYPSWVSFDPSHFADVIRSLEVVASVVVDARELISLCNCANVTEDSSPGE